MDPLAEFVEAYAPGLLGAVPARPGTDTARIDAEVAHLLAAVWLAGPPFDDALTRVRRRLAAGFSADGNDLVDLGGAPPESINGTPGPVPSDREVTPARVTALGVAVRERVDRRARHARGARLLQSLAAAALAVVVGLGGFQVFGLGQASRVGGAVAPTSSVTAVPTPAGGPTAQTAACPYSVCRWESVQEWTTGVKEAVHSTVDPSSAVFGSTNPRPMVTTVAEVQDGRFMEAGFGSEVAGATATFGLSITVTTRRDLLPVCGAKTGARCVRATTRAGQALTTSQGRRGIEVFHHTSDGSWVHVLATASPGVGSGGGVPFDLAALIRLATDGRLVLPT